MMKALIKGGLLGGLAMFIWGTISWTVLPWRRTSFRTFTDENAVAQVLVANAPRRGVYVLPNPFRAGSLPVDGPQAFVTFDERRPDSRGSSAISPIGIGGIFPPATPSSPSWTIPSRVFSPGWSSPGPFKSRLKRFSPNDVPLLSKFYGPDASVGRFPRRSRCSRQKGPAIFERSV